MNTNDTPADAQEHAASQPLDTTEQSWEEIEPGRFMPRRIRGSYRGGKLG